MVRHKGVGELISGNRHGQQFGDSVGQEGLFKDLSHRWTLLGFFDQHLGNNSLQVI